MSAASAALEQALDAKPCGKACYRTSYGENGASLRIGRSTLADNKTFFGRRLAPDSPRTAQSPRGRLHRVGVRALDSDRPGLGDRSCHVRSNDNVCWRAAGTSVVPLDDMTRCNTY